MHVSTVVGVVGAAPHTLFCDGQQQADTVVSGGQASAGLLGGQLFCAAGFRVCTPALVGQPALGLGGSGGAVAAGAQAPRHGHSVFFFKMAGCLFLENLAIVLFSIVKIW